MTQSKSGVVPSNDLRLFSFDERQTLKDFLQTEEDKLGAAMLWPTPMKAAELVAPPPSRHKLLTSKQASTSHSLNLMSSGTPTGASPGSHLIHSDSTKQQMGVCTPPAKRRKISEHHSQPKRTIVDLDWPASIESPNNIRNVLMKTMEPSTPDTNRTTPASLSVSCPAGSKNNFPCSTPARNFMSCDRRNPETEFPCDRSSSFTYKRCEEEKSELGHNTNTPALIDSPRALIAPMLPAVAMMMQSSAEPHKEIPTIPEERRCGKCHRYKVLSDFFRKGRSDWKRCAKCQTTHIEWYQKRRKAKRAAEQAARSNQTGSGGAQGKSGLSSNAMADNRHDVVARRRELDPSTSSPATPILAPLTSTSHTTTSPPTQPPVSEKNLAVPTSSAAPGAASDPPSADLIHTLVTSNSPQQVFKVEAGQMVIDLTEDNDERSDVEAKTISTELRATSSVPVLPSEMSVRHVVMERDRILANLQRMEIQQRKEKAIQAQKEADFELQKLDMQEALKKLPPT